MLWLSLKAVDRLSACIPRFDLVPEGNLAFPVLPAQIYLPPVFQCREVQQSQVDVFDQHIPVLDLMDEQVKSFEILDHVAQGAVSTVPGRFLDGGPGFGLVPEYRLAD